MIYGYSTCNLGSNDNVKVSDDLCVTYNCRHASSGHGSARERYQSQRNTYSKFMKYNHCYLHTMTDFLAFSILIHKKWPDQVHTDAKTI